MVVFDPVMGERERAVLTKLGCGVIAVNEEGKRCCCEGDGLGGAREGPGAEGRQGHDQCRPTLFFMPHCPMRLYSNLLWANWTSEALGCLVILGNSLAAYSDRIISADALQDPSNSVLRAAPLLEELPASPTPAESRKSRDAELLPHAEAAFSDMSISFSPPERRRSEEGLWALGRRPIEFDGGPDGELVTGRAVTS
ncbi:unnamed protein product [Discosporangium mesarthrocarpum]